MKKITVTTSFILATIAACAQDDRSYEMQLNQKMIEIFATVLSFVFIMLFILAILRRVLEYRLRNKVIDRQVTEHIALTVLGDGSQGRESRYLNVKWFALLAGLGTGLLIVHYTQPLGIHSIAILCLSIAAGFLGYHLFVSSRKDERKG